MTAEICGAPTRAGDPCEAAGMPQFDGRCIGHGPGAESARKKGGHHSSLQIRGQRALQTNQLRQNDDLLLHLMNDACKVSEAKLPRLRILLSAISERRRGFDLALRLQELQRQTLTK